MIEKGQLKNIVFDFGNVLIKWDVEAILKEYTDNTEDLKKLREIIFDTEEWLQMDEGILNAEQAEKIFLDRAPAGLQGQVREIMCSWFEKVEFNREICDFIKKLKYEGYHVYGLSNTNFQFFDHIKKSDIAGYFDGFIISAVEKMVKPDKNIFYRLFQKFSLNPAECFFIDDMEKNVAAARECGMNGFVFDIGQFWKLEREFEVTAMRN